MKRVALILAAAAAVLAGTVLAEERPPLAANMYVGTLTEVNGFDGLPLPDGSHIEFRPMYKAGTGLASWMVYAPESSWLETRNPLKATSKVGAGVIQSARGHGLFAACVSGLATTNPYVARLFSGPTPEESVAYCDSRPFSYTGDATRSVTNVTFGVWKAMDGSALDTATDTDGDGLPDSVEDLLALTDPDDPDTDGDGFSDGFEYTHNMDPLEPYQLAIALEIVPPNDESWQDAGADPEPLYSLTWAALSGRTYQVEYQPTMSPVDAGNSWKPIAKTNMSVTTDKLMYHLEDIEDDDVFEEISIGSSGFFRVRQLDSSANAVEEPGEDPLGE